MEKGTEMATFHIYQDLEKENHQLVPIKGAGKTEFGEQRKEMRSRGGALADLPVNSDVGVPVKVSIFFLYFFVWEFLFWLKFLC